MSIQRRLIYMVLGGLLTVTLFVGAFATFAQSGEEGENEESTVPEVETEEGSAENGSEESSSESVTPFGRGFHGFNGGNNADLLAEALGITVEELEAAHEAALDAAVQQAVDEGLITEEQAEELSARMLGFHKGFGFGSIDFDALLANELGITVEELQEARLAAHEARLAELVEAGAITQEQADLMLAQKAVQEYIDTEAISDALQSAYENAVNEALAAGAITQEQADLMIENMPSFEGYGLGIGGRDFHGHGHRGGGRGPGGPGGFFSAPSVDSSSNVETSGA